jgi:predicted RNA-binding protein with PIN domain
MKALVVDGYNAIYKIAHLQAMLNDSLYKARKALTELAMDYRRKVGGIDEVYVVFDGKDAYRDLSLSAPAHQVFSKSGDGDRAVIRMVQRLSGRYHVIVASDDNFVRNNSRAHNASIITISEFLATIRKKSAGSKHNTTEKKEITPEVAQEITEHLKRRIERR